MNQKYGWFWWLYKLDLKDDSTNVSGKEDLV